MGARVIGLARDLEERRAQDEPLDQHQHHANIGEGLTLSRTARYHRPETANATVPQAEQADDIPGASLIENPGWYAKSDVDGHNYNRQVYPGSRQALRSHAKCNTDFSY